MAVTTVDGVTPELIVQTFTWLKQEAENLPRYKVARTKILAAVHEAMNQIDGK